MTSQVIYSAVRLGLMEALRDSQRGDGQGALHVDELALATGTHAPSLFRLLRALAAIGVADEIEPGRFALGALGSPLCADAQDSLRGFVLMFCGDVHRLPWSALEHSVRTGETAAGHVFGKTLFDYLSQHPDVAKVFQEGQTAITRPVAAAVAQVCDLSDADVVADVGGGNGTLLAAILSANSANPGLSGILLHLPAGLAGAGSLLAAAGVADRCEVVAGSFFDTFPKRADAILLKSVMHNWDDARAVQILANCRQAIPPDSGRIFVIERVVPQRTEQLPEHVAISMADLTMLVAPGGRERTEAEFDALFAAARLRLSGITTLAGAAAPFCLLEARPA